MSSHEVPSDPSEIIDNAWTNVDKLLPTAYTESIKSGWVELFLDSGNLFIRNPRQRGNFWMNAVSRAAGKPTEAIRIQHRDTSIGTLKEWLTVTGSRYEKTPPPKLVISDNIYTPVNPVDGNTNPIRNTWILFRHMSGVDAEYSLYEQGLIFSFWETINENGEHKRQLQVKHHTSVHPSYAPAGSEEVDEWIVENGFSRPYSQEGRAEAVGLLEFCIAEAQKAS